MTDDSSEIPSAESLGRDINAWRMFRDSKTPAPLLAGLHEGPPQTRLTPWMAAKSWTVEEAALLVCGFDPSTYCETTFGQSHPRATGLCGGSFAGRNQFAKVTRIQEAWRRQLNAPEKMTPNAFVQWCEASGINSDWLRNGLQSTGSSSDAKQRGVAWQELVLSALHEEGLDPRSLPKSKGVAGIKRVIRDKLIGKVDGFTSGTFDHAWKDLRKAGEIGDQ